MSHPRSQSWADLVRVRARFQRSVHLERDAHSDSALEGYVLTPLVRTLTGRIIDGYDAASPSRAWSITGPYGTGKSAFALFLADIFTPPDVESSETARHLLASADPALHARLCGPNGAFPESDGLWTVLATGERRPLDEVLLRALRDSVNAFWSGPGAKPGIVQKVNRAAMRSAGGERVPPRDVVALFEETAEKVVASHLSGRGLIVVLDEAGKILEHASQNPECGDAQLLQELAEAANRSADAPIVLAVLLHQAFEQYAGRLSLTERSEWAKVQGRFEDLAFQEASREVLRLVGEAIDPRQPPKQLRAQLEEIVKRSLPHFSQQAGGGKRLEPLLRAALPLHPFTAVILGPLFRSRVAQNERSLFAFLGSNEPHAFQEFLQAPVSTDGRPALFLPDVLYDYVTGSLGGRLDGHLGKQWAQIETALRRLPSGATALDARIIKTVGILGLFGDAAGVPCSEGVLREIFAGGVRSAESAVTEALDRLRAASLIIFRKFRGAYQLWEGSDLDVDALVRDALSQVDGTATLVQRLTRVAPPRPIVARKHLLETGTFRYFDLRYVDVGAFDDGFPEVDRNADGVILLVVEPVDAARTKLIKRLKQPMTWLGVAGADMKPIVVGVPRHVGRLLEVGAELAALEWVQTHTPELQDDLVARREVATRIAEAERQLRGELGKLLGGDGACEWLHRAEPVQIGSARDLARAVSNLCAEVYAKAPAIQNELLNRRQLSSAAAAARRSLMEAMATKGAQPRLGFEGTPPEVSMYRSLLEHHGLHREGADQWAFVAPKNKHFGSLRPVWDAMERALRDAREERLAVPSLFEHLRRPPFGLKEGVLPVLLTAAILSWKDEMAIYEDGAFTSSLTGAVLERLLRQPDRFEVQRVSIAGPRAVLHERLMQTLSGAPNSSKGVVPLVRQLVRVVSDLPSFSRTTKTISAKAQAVREVLLRAREPAPLVFRDLPVACGLEAFSSSGSPAPERVEAYVQELRGAMREVQLAYPTLLDSIETSLRAALGLPADSREMRQELAIRAALLLPVATDVQLKAFLIRATDQDMPRDEWLVSMGTLLGGKPPEAWHDRDSDQAGFATRLLAQRFSSLESMVVGLGVHPDRNAPNLLRVAVTHLGQSDSERTVTLRSGEDDVVRALAARLKAVTDGMAASLPRDGVLAALGLVVQDIIGELNAGRATRRGIDA